MKRIGIDIRPLLKERRDGVPTYASEMTRALAARRDHRYALFLNAWGRPGHTMPPSDIPPESDHVEHRFTRFPNRALNAGFRLGFPDLQRLTGPLDALWLPNLDFIACDAPMIVTVHDLSFTRYPRFFTRKQRLWHASIDPARTIRRAARVAAVSEHTKADVIERYGVPESRVFVAPPGIASRFAPQPAEETGRIRAKYALDRPFFLFLGTIEPRKNVEGIIAAHEMAATDADLVIAGGKGWLYEKAVARAARSAKRDRIRFLGYVDETDKPGLYSASAALVYPSFYEGFGMPPAEAMACGTPVIAGRDSSLAETVGEAGLLVDPYDVGEIGRAMDAVLEESALAPRLREAGLERAKRFTWEKSAAALSDAFSRITE